jgi:hypothetical protein
MVAAKYKEADLGNALRYLLNFREIMDPLLDMP